MKRQIRNHGASVGASVLGAALALAFGTLAAPAAVTVGSTAPNFSVRNHATGLPLRLYDYQGKIVVLDFWAYWCGPCQAAAVDIEPNIVDYYRNNGGNINGVPVQVISISVDLSDMTAENNYIQTYGLELVGDDNSGTYGIYGDGYIPYLLVINGTTNSTNYRAWEVLYSQAGYTSGSTVPAMKGRIDSIQTVAPVAVLTEPVPGALVEPPNVPLSAVVTNNGKIIKRVDFYNGSTLIGSKTTAPYSLTWSNVTAGAKTVFARAVYGSSSGVNSTAVTFTVGTPTPIQASLARQGDDLLLSWSGSPGLFRVQMRTNLVTDSWQYMTAASTNTSLTITPTQGAAFYRVIRP